MRKASSGVQDGGNEDLQEETHELEGSTLTVALSVKRCIGIIPSFETFNSGVKHFSVAGDRTAS